MITQEDFTRITNDIKNNVFISPTDAALLVQTVAEMDAHLHIAQSTLDFTLRHSTESMRDVAVSCTKIIGLRDKAKERRMLKVAGECAARLAAGVQLHLAGEIMAASNIVDEDPDLDEDQGVEEL
jgi:hypothetical protein